MEHRITYINICCILKRLYECCSPQRAHRHRYGGAMLTLVPTKTRTGRRFSKKPRQSRLEITLLVLLFSYACIALMAVVVLSSDYNVVYYRNYRRHNLSQDESANGKPIVVESKSDYAIPGRRGCEILPKYLLIFVGIRCANEMDPSRLAATTRFINSQRCLHCRYVYILT